MDIKLEIIKLVKKYDCLYNTQSPQNKNFVYKRDLWEKIGKEVGISGTIAKREFKTVRDTYKKWQNKRLRDSSFQRPYKYAEYLQFLDDHMIFRGAPIKPLVSTQDVEVISDESSDLDSFRMRTDLKSKIIEKVKQHDCFYNIYSPEYNNFEYKQQLWIQFEEELGISADQIEAMWTNLIDCYKKYKQNADGKFKYADNLKFIDDYILAESEPNNETFIISFLDDDDDNGNVEQIGIDSSNNSDLLVELNRDPNIKLIEAVKNYDCLYNVNSPHFKDVEFRKELWNRFGKEIGLPAEVVKRRWRGIKDYYRKCKLNTGTNYKYAEYLTFLDDHIGFQSKPNNESILVIDDDDVNDSSCDLELLNNDSDVNIKIIEAVKNYYRLHDTQTPPFTDFDYTEELWNEIGNEIGMPANSVINRWRYIKQYYIKFRECHITTYKYAEYLDFLDDHIAPQIETDLHLQIIEEVKKCRCLYDVDSDQYKDFEYKQQLWYKIGKKLGISIDDVKAKWKHVKDYYKRCKQIPHAKYKYAEYLKFLDEYLVQQSKDIRESSILDYEEKGTESTSYDGTEVVNIKLINAVRKYDCLYNEQSPKYRDIKLRQKLWAKIGQDIGRSKDYAKKRWHNLLYKYKKCKEKMLKEGPNCKLYKYMGYLTFLEEYVRVQRDDRNNSQYSVDITSYTDASSDSDLLYIPPAKKGKRNFEDSPEEIHDLIDEPVSTTNLRNITGQWFEKENFENSQDEMKILPEEPVTTNSLKKSENSPHSSSEQFEKLNFENSLENTHDCSENSITIKKEIPESPTSQYFEKENTEEPPREKENHGFLEEPMSVQNSRRVENPKSSTSQWFELLAKKINESNITAEQKNDIEFAVSSLVYSKLAEYSK